MASSYKILDINNCKPQENTLYFLDANIWLILIQPSIEIKDYQKIYIRFIEQILNWKGKNSPKIVINSLVVSEVINAYLRSRFEIWKQNTIQMAKTEPEKMEEKELNFKLHYRIDPEYKIYLDNVKDELLSRKEFCIILDNTEEENDIWRIIKELDSSADFNDNFYAEMAIDKNYTIITNDADFIFPHIPILTANNKLLKV